MQSKVKARCVSVSILAILLLSSMLALVPITPVSAAIETATATIDYKYAIQSTSIERTIKVNNPVGNPAITSITVSVDTATASSVPSEQPIQSSGFAGSITKAVAGMGPWAIVVTSTVTEMLPGGAAAKFDIGFTTKAEATDKVVDTCTLTVSISFKTGEIQNTPITIYKCKAASLTVTPTPKTETVGKSIEYTVATDTADKGLPITMKYSPTVSSGFTASFTPSTGTTDADGKFKSTFVCTQAGTYEISVDLGALDAFSTGGALSVTPASLTLNPDVPTKVRVKVQEDDGATLTYLTLQHEWVKASLADTYGNPVKVTSDTTVTFSATAGTLTPTTAIIHAGTDTSDAVDYAPVSDYGTYAMISAKLTIDTATYSGNSRSLCTSTFADGVTVTPDPTSVKAGSYSTITLQLTLGESASKQKGVPVAFSITAVTSGYTGSLTVTSTVTDADGKATTKLNVDTRKDYKAKVKATVSKPTSGTPTNTFTGETVEIATIAGDPSKLVVKTYEHGTATARTTTVPSGVLDVVVSLADAYGNVATNTFAGSIQVGLSATSGALSVTTAYILVDKSDTKDWGTILFTAPSATGTVTITATTTQAGVGPGSATVTVAGPEPVVTITNPATDTEVPSDVTVTYYVAGYVEVSPAEPSGTAISLITYSLNGAANVSTPITKVEAGKYYFNFSVSLAPQTTNTVTVYAKDTKDKIGFATRVIKIVPYLPPGTGTFTPSAPKLLNSAGAVVTSIASNTQFFTQITLKSNSATDLSVYVLAQIKDSAGRVVAMGLTAADVKAGATKDVPVAFLGIATPGTYTVTIFVWSSITEPTALAPTTTFTIVVT